MISIHTYTPRESFGSNMYLIEADGEFAVVDPSVDCRSVLSEHPGAKHATRYIIVTHSHFDHILAIDSWREETGAEVIVSGTDGVGLSDSYRNAYSIFFGLDKGYKGKYTSVTDGEILTLGSESLSVIFTPGHTAGGISVRIGNSLFVGDTVFSDGGYGRCDLHGGDFETLAYSIRHLCSLDPTLTVYPGHGRATNIAEIRCFFSNL